LAVRLAYLALGIHEYGGIATSSALDAISGNLGSGCSLSSAPATTTTSGDLIFSCGVEDAVGSGDTFTAGSGFTVRVNLGAAAAYADQDRIQSSAGAVAAIWSLSPANSWIAAMAAFRPVGATPANEYGARYYQPYLRLQVPSALMSQFQDRTWFRKGRRSFSTEQQLP